MDVSLRIRERSYQLWEQEERPEGQHLHHWLQAERELVAEHALEFKQLMRDFRSGIINEKTVEQVMNDLEKWALSNSLKCPNQTNVPGERRGEAAAALAR